MITSTVRTMIWMTALTLVASLGGCSMLGAVGYKTIGPGAIKADYVPPPQEPMLVLVENYHGVEELKTDAANLSEAVYKEMKDNKVASLVDPAALEKLKDADPEKYRQMGVAEIGRAVGAQQILYVNLQAAELEMPVGKQTIRGHMEVVVRLIDAKTKLVAFPDTEKGDTIKIDTPIIQHNSPTVEAQVHVDMASLMATEIGHVFHDWKPPYDNQEKVDTNGLADGPGSGTGAGTAPGN